MFLEVVDWDSQWELATAGTLNLINAWMCLSTYPQKCCCLEQGQVSTTQHTTHQMAWTLHRYTKTLMHAAGVQSLDTTTCIPYCNRDWRCWEVFRSHQMEPYSFKNQILDFIAKGMKIVSAASKPSRIRDKGTPERNSPLRHCSRSCVRQVSTTDKFIPVDNMALAKQIRHTESRKSPLRILYTSCLYIK